MAEQFVVGSNARIEINGDVIEGINTGNIPSPTRAQYEVKMWEKAVKRASGAADYGSIAFEGVFLVDSTAQVSIRTLWDSNDSVTNWKFYPDVTNYPNCYIDGDTALDPDTHIKISEVDRVGVTYDGIATWGFTCQLNGPWKWNGRE